MAGTLSAAAVIVLVAILLLSVIPIMAGAAIVGAERAGFWPSFVALIVSAVLHAFGGAQQQSAENLPMAVYTIPEISYVGLTEKEVQQTNAPYVVGRAYFKDSARGQINGDAHGVLKLVVDANTEKLLGVHIVGEQASELVHIGQLVMNLNGTVRDLISNVFNYPTLAECYKLAAVDCTHQLELRKTA